MNRLLPRINTSRTSNATETTDIILPTVTEITLIKNIDPIEPKEAIKSADHETEKERSIRLKTIREKYTFRFPVRPLEQINHITIKRSISSANGLVTIQRKKRVDLKPIILNKKRNKHQQQKSLIRTRTDLEKKENTMIIEEDEQEQQNELIGPLMIIEENGDRDTPVVCAVD